MQRFVCYVLCLAMVALTRPASAQGPYLSNGQSAPVILPPSAETGEVGEVVVQPNPQQYVIQPKPVVDDWEHFCTLFPGGGALADATREMGGFPNHGLYIIHGYEAWRGISEGSGDNNNGFMYGLNYGTRLGVISDWTGIGAQVGASYGLYDLNGRASGFSDDKWQQQGFFTAGLFRKPDGYTNFSFGVVWDAMINDNFGQYAVSPFISQLRAQIAYDFNDHQEVGFWTSLRMSGDHVGPQNSLAFRAVDQFNIYYHHKFDFGGDGVTWIGVPDHTKLGGNGSLGQYIFGGTISAPISKRWAAYSDVQYMAPSAGIGTAGSMEDSFYVGFGLILYPGGNLGAGSLIDHTWMPYQSVATNGSFLVDTNHTF